MIPVRSRQAARERSNLEGSIADLMSGFSVETTPGAAAKIPDYRTHLAPGTRVFITFLPGSDLDDTIATAVRLGREGLDPVPHLAARSIPDARFLEESLRRLTDEAGVREVLAIGGGVASPVGAFSDSMQMLETGLLDRFGITRIGVAGHPEGSPDISDEDIASALEWKDAFAQRSDADLHVVTQFCFEAGPVIAWEQRLRAAGIRLPLHVGLPGLATIKSLLGHAKACGVGASMTFLTKQARKVTRLLSVSAPDQLVCALAAYRAGNPDCNITGAHVYPLGGLRKSARWSYAAAAGQLTMNARGDGFRVDVELD
jgi:methylenetetrahydrofolate reductase (NADPH)